MSRRWLPVLFVAGAITLVAFETTLTLALGVALLLATVGAGWRLIAEPGFLEGDADARPVGPEPPERGESGP